MQNGTCLAAIDIGSNSFRLEIGRLEFGHIQRLDYLRETIRQGNGLDAHGNLSDEAMERGWHCLERFGERLRGFAPANVRAVATQTLREARNRDVFLLRGQELLGYPIEVITGQEEARLIYQGVSRLLAQSNDKRFVIDIGGRSTELIAGQQYQAQRVDSYPLGSVVWSQQFFPQGIFIREAFDAAESAAQSVLHPALSDFPPNSWDVVYGSSGTARAVGDVLLATGQTDGSITRSALHWLKNQLLQCGSAARLDIPGMKEDRRTVIGGGVSVLCAVFDAFHIETMQVAQGALRQGALFSLLPPSTQPSDLQSLGLQGLMQIFKIDSNQANRTAEVASILLLQAMPSATEAALHDLHCAALLHEIGCAIAHSDAHLHGAYILQHTTVAGFGGAGLFPAAKLIQGHQGKVRKLDLPWQQPLFALQLLCLRLAITLCHARTNPDIEDVKLECQDRQFNLQVSTPWALKHPLSFHLLQEEAQNWQKTGWSISVVSH